MVSLIDIFLHLDQYLSLIVSQYSTLTYVFLFLIIFMETGLVVTPFLPGDSLLFAIGALAATDVLNIELVFLVIFIAAILGDTLNYHIGKVLGPKLFRKEDSFFFHKNYLVRSQTFYEKHGGKTIILARFIPIIRTFAPFVAGMGTMSYRKFLIYNVVGAALWCGLFIFSGYFLGNLPFVQENFNSILLIIVFLSLAPLVKEIVVHFRAKKNVIK